MEVEFLDKFSRDLDKISNKSVKKNIARLILHLEAVTQLTDIQQLKKLKGHRSAYRVRIADYRVGFFLEGQKIIIARVIHRKEIYKVFP